MELDPAEQRVLGCLLEKHLSTPQYYPLTLNSLTAACNQTSNRDPVTHYGEGDVGDAVAALRERGLVRVVHSSGNRAVKFRHVLDEAWGLDDQHRAILAVLLLRGPQTTGELRTRTERLARFDSLAEIDEVVRLLSARDQPLARTLDRAPGQKEARVTHLLGPQADAPAQDAHAAPRQSDLEARVERLERAVQVLQTQLASGMPGVDTTLD